jgi:hypothetical protein
VTKPEKSPRRPAKPDLKQTLKTVLKQVQAFPAED